MKLKTNSFILSLMVVCINNACAQSDNQIRFDGVYRTPEQAYNFHLEGCEPETRYLRSYLRFYADGTVIYTGATENTIIDSLYPGNPAVYSGKYTFNGDSISFDITDNADIPFLSFKGLVSDIGKHLDLEMGTYYNGDRAHNIKYDFFSADLKEHKTKDQENNKENFEEAKNTHPKDVG